MSGEFILGQERFNFIKTLNGKLNGCSVERIYGY